MKYRPRPTVDRPATQEELELKQDKYKPDNNKLYDIVFKLHFDHSDHQIHFKLIEIAV